MKQYCIDNADKRWEYMLKHNYNLSKETYNQMLLNQDNKCKICLTDASKFKKRLAVDHCHTTDIVRGLLCSDCNRGIGLLKDAPENILRAYEYLKEERKHND